MTLSDGPAGVELTTSRMVKNSTNISTSYKTSAHASHYQHFTCFLRSILDKRGYPSVYKNLVDKNVFFTSGVIQI